MKVSGLEKAAKRVVPGNTLQSTKWAVNISLPGRSKGTKGCHKKKIELDILLAPSSPECLCYVLQLFVLKCVK